MYPKLYIEYLYHFHYTRDYFECHEVLEELWKSEKPIKRDSVWVGLIQLAVALYHQRRDNFVGANKLISSATEKMKNQKVEMEKIGIDYIEILNLSNKIKHSIEIEASYQSYNLPIKDNRLRKELTEYASKQGINKIKYNVEDLKIIHRHLEPYRSMS
ncbi:DUF309 domain-containing protein [Halalkalibacillus sediminis]|uniref:DUF309 domain-containing protein n=1 Tax=Halalkalibacillus sediminis TaxID=2018042 RepID=A0A2I0QX53_9BACI|nr:DUF309 domain-containing protein [Halalkalibacillus sediminis]PKR78895.1 DUF309 domain-containing protein [Halalkalibacillus sediminis]